MRFARRIFERRSTEIGRSENSGVASLIGNEDVALADKVSQFLSTAVRILPGWRIQQDLPRFAEQFFPAKRFRQEASPGRLQICL